MQMGVVCFGPAVRESKQLWWTMSWERSREVLGTNKHATMLPSRQHIPKKSMHLQNSVYCACDGGMQGA
jgi:hypothetical protein